MDEIELNERQVAILRNIAAGLNGIMSADRIAYRLGYKPARSGRLAVSSTLKVLMKKELVGRIPPEDQWSHADYFLKPGGKAALTQA